MIKDQHRTPLVEALCRHAKGEKVSLHIPGHKMHGFWPLFKDRVGAFADFDVTELPGLDDLHHPVEAIADASMLAAQAFGSDEAFFLVGGSTVGNLAAIMSVASEDDLLLVGRNAHQSVWNAIHLARATSIALMPELEGESVFGGISPSTVREAVHRYPKAVALVITSPTYHGFASDLREIVRIAHEVGMVVIVDEAHGAHFPFLDSLPVSAIHAGADLVIQSPHKMLGGFTQTGILHVVGQDVSRERIRYVLRILQSSSPSYLLLASIDAARAHMAVNGRSMLQQVIASLERSLTRLQLHGCAPFLHSSAPKDPFKWNIDAHAFSLDGFALAEQLRQNDGIYVELADERYVLLSWSYASTDRDIELTEQAFLRLWGRRQQGAQGSHVADRIVVNHLSAIPRISAPIIPMKLLFSDRAVKREIQDAVGYAVVDHIAVYPPGIPILLPGELVTQGVCDFLQEMVGHGIRVDGIDELQRVNCAD